MLIWASSLSYYERRKRQSGQAKPFRKEVSPPSSQFLACLGATFCQERGNFEVDAGTFEKYSVI